MYCPLCATEYRPGFTVCSDCQVALVPDPPRNPSAHPPIDDKSDGTSFVLVWSGSDARIHAEICEALERQKIPARTLGSEDHLFNLTTRPAFEVYVPADLVNSAQQAIKKVDALEESVELSESDLLEIPASEGLPNEPNENDGEMEDEERDDRLNFDPQDATVEIWSGRDADMAAMIASSLRENHIPYRSDPDMPKPDIADPQSAPDTMTPTKIFVSADDAKRAKEIIREIVDAAPPE